MAAALEQHFAEQLHAAGWFRTDGGEGTTAAWSAWATDASEPKTGLLLVLARPEPDSRGLSLRVETSTRPGPSGWVTTTGIARRT